MLYFIALLFHKPGTATVSLSENPARSFQFPRQRAVIDESRRDQMPDFAFAFNGKPQGKTTVFAA